jgi:hypothetical protein
MKNKRKYEDGGATTAEVTAKKRLKQLQKKMSRNSVAFSRPDFSARAN